MKDEILTKKDSGQKKADVCREYDISSRTLSTLIKNKDKIRGNCRKAGRNTRPYKCVSVYEDVDQALKIWFTQALADDVPISGPISLGKANELAKEFGYDEGKQISKSWIDRFKCRYGIDFLIISGEAASAKKY